MLYFTLINLITFFIYGVDKYFAKKKMYRISEKILFFLSIVGGFIGSILSIYFFHHKSRKIMFKVVNIFSFLLWCVLFFS